ncbi:MAG: 5-formyltetrahydrofolate cyclo-ligase [Vallitaleaceae bacterium]|jgi:5-formyltetrahydrofolate cyclo-ligase|nr:5-formyltetrahydrofolate cyclo-ligase [Vallitaleaceae bacterium]
MSMKSEGLTKRQIRQILLEKRNALEDKEVKENSQYIIEQIIVSKEYQACKQLFLYSPKGNEIDVSKLFSIALKDNKTIAFPKVMSKEEIAFYRVSSLDDLQEGTFGVYEPNTQEGLVGCSRETLMIIPGIAFDQQGNRIGFGAGYYDRYLSKNTPLASFGVAYPWQIFEQLPKEEYDIALTRILGK